MILDTIAEATKNRVEALKKKISFEDMKQQASDLPKGDFLFEKALRSDNIAFICEVKKASPSKGLIAEEFDPVQIAKEYEAAGAAAISVLTEPEFFMGSNDYLTQINQNVDIPVLRKDFTIDEYQLYEAKVIGADAVLLICALLDTETIKAYLAVCDDLGLSAIVEAHNEKEALSALNAGARIIGVNNRDLKTFEVDLNTSIRLREQIPANLLFVAESGIQTAQDIQMLRGAGVDAVLIGETLMRSENKRAKLAELRGE